MAAPWASKRLVFVEQRHPDLYLFQVLGAAEVVPRQNLQRELFLLCLGVAQEAQVPAHP